MISTPTERPASVSAPAPGAAPGARPVASARAAPPPPSAVVATDPLVAIVIPIYKQPQFLKDAVVSGLRQSMGPRIKVVIVNDGCPYADTDWLGRYFQATFPGQVVYLKKRNGGLSSARNYGIRFALDAWPSVQAVIPLDADDALAPGAVEKLWTVLAASPPEVGWAYQDTTHFGTSDLLCLGSVPFSTYRLIHENLCTACSLIHRRLFEDGLAFDEAMRAGYEDWEFWIHASLRGFRGVHVPDTGFMYRQRGHSMLTGSRERHQAIYATIGAKHGEALGPRALTAIEHDELPRFAAVDLGSGTVRCFTNPLESPSATITVDELVRALVAWELEPSPKTTFVPPVVVLAEQGMLDLLRDLRLLPGLLLALQRPLARNDYACVSLGLASNPTSLQMELGTDGGEPALIAVTSRKLADLARIAGDELPDMIQNGRLVRELFDLKVGPAFLGEGHADLIGRLYGGLERRLALRNETIRALRDDPNVETRSEPVSPGGLIEGLIDFWGRVAVQLRTAAERTRPERTHGRATWALTSHTDFAVIKHVSQGETTFPYFVRGNTEGRPRLDLLFAVPWIRLGGVDQCVLNLAAGLADLGLYRLHLVPTDCNDVDADPRSLAAFDTITFLPSDESDRRKTILDLAGAMDVIVDANSLAFYDLLPELRRQGRASFISYLHAIGYDQYGNPVGFPFIAARTAETLIDRFVVISQQLRRLCQNLGVPREKLTVMPNAPVVAPASETEARALADEKCRRGYSADRPLRVLFSGRFDHEKGIERLETLIARFNTLDVPVHFSVVGKAVLAERRGRFTTPNVTVHPPTLDKARLARHYTEADVFVLPSRSEGVPLAALEAMAFGNVVISTDVGAVREIIEPGRTGVLVAPGGGDDAVARGFEAAILDVLHDPRGYDPMRRAASALAAGTTWRGAAEQLSALIEQVAPSRRMP